MTLTFQSDSGFQFRLLERLGDAHLPTLTFTPLNWSTPQGLRFYSAPDDNTVTETISLEHLASGGDYAGYTDTYTITVRDNAISTAAINLSVEPATVSESAAPTEVTVTATLDGAAFPTATEVTVTVAGETATAGDDFAALTTPLTLTIAAQTQSASATFTLSPVADDVAEGDETLTVSGTVTGALQVNAATLTIEDDEERGLAVSETALTVAEGGQATYTVALTSEPTGAVEVAPSARGADAAELSLTPAVLTFTAANWETLQTVTVSAAADADAGNDAAVIAHVVSGADYGNIATAANNVSVTITDDDTASTVVALTVTPGSVAEGAEPTQVTVTAALNAAPRKTGLSVQVQVGTATATAGEDFVEVDDFTLTIPAGATNASGTFTLEPLDDAVAEGAELVEVSGSAAGLAVNGTTATITDDDTASTVVALTAEPATVREDAEPTEVTVTAALDAGARDEDTEVAVSVVSGTATAGTDFAEVAEVVVTITAGETEGRAAFTLEPLDDELAEGPETVRLVPQALAGMTVTETTVEITDDDTTSTAVTLTAEPASVAEAAGATVVEVTATLGGAVRTEATIVTVTVAPGTAEAGTDFVAVGSFEVMIPVGEPTGTGTFTLEPLDDALAEGPETVELSGSTPDDLTVGGATVEILDDDAASTAVALMAEPANVDEDAGVSAGDDDGDTGRRRAERGDGGDGHRGVGNGGSRYGLHGGRRLRADDCGRRYLRHGELHPGAGGRRLGRGHRDGAGDGERHGRLDGDRDGD